MHLNTTPVEPPRKPCMRDYSELLRDHLPAPLVKLSSLEELRRRCHEIVAEHPRFREEVPLALADEEYRRQRLSGQLQVTNYQSLSLQHHA